MNTIKILGIWGVALLIIAFVAALAMGLNFVFAAYRILFVILAAIHIVCAHALFEETRRIRRENKNVFLSLDPLFWSMVGLIFGVFALLLYRIINDRFQELQAQPDDARNGGNAPEEERSP